MMLYGIYDVALRALIGIKDKLTIVIVGANDGKTADPIYDFVMRRSGETNILLIEPNKSLLPYLQSNYSSHPSHQIANCAIGKEGTLTLYAVKQEYWDDFQPAYAKGWKSYCAATGITSAIKSHLERGIKSHLGKTLAQKNLDPDDAIDVFNIPCKELKTLLDEVGWSASIDVLQIDAEGYDDEVIYNSNLSYTRPRLIFFESANLPKEKLQSLIQYLSQQRYRTYHSGINSLAVDSRFDPACIFLNLVVIMFRCTGIELGLRVVNKLFRVMKNLNR